MQLFTLFQWTTNRSGSITGKYGTLFRERIGLENGQSAYTPWYFYNSYTPRSWFHFWYGRGCNIAPSRNPQRVLQQAERLILQYRLRFWSRVVLLCSTGVGFLLLVLSLYDREMPLWTLIAEAARQLFS